MTSGRRGSLGLRALVALRASVGGATLREVARALGARDSSAQYALRTLLRDDVASLDGSLYRPRAGRRAELELERAFFELGAEEALSVASRASRAVELAAFDPAGAALQVVIKSTADPAAVVAFRETLRLVAPGTRLHEHQSSEIEGTTEEDRRRRASLCAVFSGGRLLTGDLEKVLGATRRPDLARVRPLGRVHPTLRLPSRREKQRIARRHGVDEISLFGSATRDDLAAASDVDVLVHFRGGAVPTLGSLAGLTRGLSEVFDRRIDVLDTDSVEPAFIPTIERDRVTIYGRPHALVPRTGEGVRGARDRGPRAARPRLGGRSREPRRPHASR